jgi:hypothetical protein
MCRITLINQTKLHYNENIFIFSIKDKKMNVVQGSNTSSISTATNNEMNNSSNNNSHFNSGYHNQAYHQQQNSPSKKVFKKSLSFFKFIYFYLFEAHNQPVQSAMNSNFQNVSNDLNTMPLSQTTQTVPTTTALAGSSPATSKNISIILPGDKKPKLINNKKQDIKDDVVSLSTLYSISIFEFVVKFST